MATKKKTKYGKCIHTKDLIRNIPYYGGKSIVAHDGELDAKCSIADTRRSKGRVWYPVITRIKADHLRI